MIKEAIIPLAGLGTRLLPFSKILPKELLPLGNKTILEHILDECLEAGIKKIILVTSKRKKIIKDYLYPDPYLLNYLKKKKDIKSIQKLKILDRYRKKIKFVYQNYPKGLGDAVLAAKRGQAEFRSEKRGIVSSAVGKSSFSPDELRENVKALLLALYDSRPEGFKGSFVRAAFLSSTHGQGIPLSLAVVDPANASFMSSWDGRPVLA